MARVFASILTFLIGWFLFLAWLTNHRVEASRGPWGKDLPDLTLMEAWIVPTAIWLAASWWSFRAPGARRDPLPAAGLVWRSLLLGLAMLVGAFGVWLALSLARWSVT